MNQLTAVVTLLFTTVVACNACYYRRFTWQHTVCKPRNLMCQIIENRLSNNEINLILGLHNHYREIVAMGRGGLPSASNMMEMVWDNELAIVAQKHANRCQFSHDCRDCRKVDRFKVGQNIYMSSSTKYPSSGREWEKMMRGFYNEVKLFRKEYIPRFRFQKGYGHFTRMVWADTWRVGCGRVVFGSGKWYKTLLTCNYGPAGNIRRHSMYKVGRPCSACPRNTCCGDSCRKVGIRTIYSGLCIRK